MQTNIKMIGLDLDGTLLRKDNTVSAHNKEAILRCLAQGIQIYLITGRPYCFAKMIAREIDERVNIIAANGGIYEIGNRCIETMIDANALMAIIDILHKHAMKAFFKGKYHFYTHEAYDQHFLYDHMNDQFHDEKVTSYCNLTWDELKGRAHNITKILVYHEDTKQLKIARKQIECIGNVEISDYREISFDIMAEDIHKGNVVKEVLKAYGLTKEHFMAIGDGNNDLVMFQEAGFKIAMGNANEQVKKACDVITKNCEDDGVAYAIEQYIGN